MNGQPFDRIRHYEAMQNVAHGARLSPLQELQTERREETFLDRFREGWSYAWEVIPLILGYLAAVGLVLFLLLLIFLFSLARVLW